MKRKKKTKVKLKEKTLSLEEVFNQVAISPPSVSRAHIVLTPLSSEACLAKGINPDALQKREFEIFQNGSSDLEIQRLKYEAYETRRHGLMETAMKEKERLNKKQKRMGAEDQSIAHSETPSLTPSVILKQQEKANATLLEIEEKRLKKAREKQKREYVTSFLIYHRRGNFFLSHSFFATYNDGESDFYSFSNSNKRWRKSREMCT